jgi:MFS family permease
VTGIFEVGSPNCGAAPNSVVFIVGRAIAGVGSAGIMNGALILITGMLPLPKRPAYEGLLGAVCGLASVMGLFLGGTLTTLVSWRWYVERSLSFSKRWDNTNSSLVGASFSTLLLAES